MMHYDVATDDAYHVDDAYVVVMDDGYDVIIDNA
jgi:hypothetical protein